MKKTVKMWIWKDFSLKTARDYDLESLIRIDAPNIRHDFVPCTITYDIPSKK